MLVEAGISRWLGAGRCRHRSEPQCHPGLERMFLCASAHMYLLFQWTSLFGVMHQAHAQCVRNLVTLRRGDKIVSATLAHQRTLMWLRSAQIAAYYLWLARLPILGPGDPVWRPPNIVALCKAHCGVSLVSPIVLVFTISVFLLVFNLEQGRYGIPWIAVSGRGDVLG